MNQKNRPKNRINTNNSKNNIQYKPISKDDNDVNDGITTNSQKYISKSNSNYKVTLPVIFGLVIIIVGFILFARTIGYDMVYCDDDVMIVDTYEYNKDLSNIGDSFRHTFFSEEDLYYRPLLRVSLIIDANIGGMNPAYYRFTNVFIHLLCSVLLFVFFLKIKFPTNESFILSMFFTIHPIIVPAASWISGRNDSLLTFFIMISLISYIEYTSNIDNNNRKNQTKIVFLILHLLAYTCAIFTKEAAIFLPLLIVLYIVLIKKQKLFSNKNIIVGIGLAIITIIWFICRQTVVSGRGEANQLATFFFSALQSNILTIPSLLGKIFLPLRMSALSNFESIAVISGIVAIVSIIIYIVLSKQTNKNSILFGLIWFVLFISPTLIARIQDFDFDYAEHRIYLPMIGVLIVLIEILKTLKIDFRKPLAIGITSFVLLIFAATSFSYQGSFQNAMSFWGHFLDLYPNRTRGYIGIGKQYFMKDSLDKVAEIMQAGIKVKPDFKYWYANLSTVYLRKKEFDKSIYYANKALELAPDDQNSLANLGISYSTIGKYEQAIPVLEFALEKNPNNASVTIHLGDAYFKKKNYQNAIQCFLRAVQLSPEAIPAYVRLGDTYAIIGDFNNSEKVYQRIVELDPKNVQVYLNIGTSYAMRSQYEYAEKWWLKAYSIDQNSMEVMNNLAMLYDIKKDIPKIKKFATEILKRGGKLHPKVQETLLNTK